MPNFGYVVVDNEEEEDEQIDLLEPFRGYLEAVRAPGTACSNLLQ
ncbi:unnamed protein product, partial [Anisakis simplex]|uniref:Uncharacterized protein n=1 Tax=Anisakis simplex TaxID=6269 RepID=A0A0M3KKN7_ANISI